MLINHFITRFFKLKTTNEAVQAIWIEISFVNHKNIFFKPQKYHLRHNLSTAQVRFTAQIRNIPNKSKNFCCLFKADISVSTVDKPKHRRITYFSTILAKFMPIVISCLMISDHFNSQFCITASTRDKKQQIKSVKMSDLKNLV